MTMRVGAEVGVERGGRGRSSGRGWIGEDGVGVGVGRAGRRGRWQGRSLLPLPLHLLRDRGWEVEAGPVEVDDRFVIVVAGAVEGARRQRGFGGWRRDRIAVPGTDSS